MATCASNWILKWHNQSEANWSLLGKQRFPCEGLQQNGTSLFVTTDYFNSIRKVPILVWGHKAKTPMFRRRKCRNQYFNFVSLAVPRWFTALLWCQSSRLIYKFKTSKNNLILKRSWVFIEAPTNIPYQEHYSVLPLIFWCILCRFSLTQELYSTLESTSRKRFPKLQ